MCFCCAVRTIKVRTLADCRKCRRTIQATHSNLSCYVAYLPILMQLCFCRQKIQHAGLHNASTVQAMPAPVMPVGGCKQDGHKPFRSLMSPSKAGCVQVQAANSCRRSAGCAVPGTLCTKSFFRSSFDTCDATRPCHTQIHDCKHECCPWFTTSCTEVCGHGYVCVLGGMGKGKEPLCPHFF